MLARDVGCGIYNYAEMETAINVLIYVLFRH